MTVMRATAQRCKGAVAAFGHFIAHMPEASRRDFDRWPFREGRMAMRGVCYA